MKICVFTRTDDLRLQALIDKFKLKRLPISLIVATPPKPSRESLTTQVLRLTGFYQNDQFNALENIKLPVAMTENHSSKTVLKILSENNIDLLVLSKAGIIKKNIINGPWRIINCHPGVLPRYRGVGSCEWAIFENGPTGATVHYIDNNIDTGPILDRRFVEPKIKESLSEFRHRLDQIGIEMMADICNRILKGQELVPISQKRHLGILYTRKPNQGELRFVETAFEKRKDRLFGLHRNSA